MEKILENMFNRLLNCVDFDAEINLECDEEEVYNRILSGCDFSASNIFALDVTECYATINLIRGNDLAELINIVLNHCGDKCNMEIVRTLVTIDYGRNFSGNEKFHFLLGYALYCVANNINYYLFDIVFGKLKPEIAGKPEAIQAVGFVLAIMRSDNPYRMITRLLYAFIDHIDEF